MQSSDVKVIDDDLILDDVILLTDIMNRADTEASVLLHLRENWPQWATNVRKLDAEVWMPWSGRESMWWQWLQGIPGTSTFTEIADFTADVLKVPGWIDFMNFIQVYTGMTQLDSKCTSPLTRGLLTSGNGVHETYKTHMWADLASAQFFAQFTDTDPTAMENHALRAASTNGQSRLVEFLLKDKRMIPMMVLISSPNVRRFSSIHFAADNGHADIVKMLIDAGADPSSEDDLALRVACTAGHTDVVRLLLSNTEVDPMALNNWALQTAITHGHAEVTALLLADPGVIPTHVLRTAMHKALQDKYFEVLVVCYADLRVRAMMSDALTCLSLK